MSIMVPPVVSFVSVSAASAMIAAARSTAAAAATLSAGGEGSVHWMGAVGD